MCEDPITPSNVSESMVAELSGIFPGKERTDVRNALESANGNLEDACDILLTEPDEICSTVISEDNTDPLEELKIMFPDTDFDRIKSIYDRCQDVDAAITELLSLPLLLLEDDEEQKRAEKEVKTRQRAQPQPAAERAAWNSTSDKIKIIRGYTNVPASVARQAFHRSSFNALKAIIELIWTTDYYDEEPETDEKDLPKEPKLSTKTPNGGKVQSARGFAHASFNSFDLIGSKAESETPKILPKTTYSYSESSKEARELREIVQSNAAMRCINRTFLKRALTFYKGNLSMTVSLASHIIDADLSSATFKSPQDISALELKRGFQLTTIKSQKNLSSSRTTACSSQDGPLKLQNDENYEKGLRMIDNLFEAPRLDFHGFVPKDAIDVLRICLVKWWKEELSKREINRHKLSISRVLNVSPLEVVTGRGIHSVGGVSTLKIKVRRFLNDNNYLFSEEPAYFIVEGKKK